MSFPNPSSLVSYGGALNDYAPVVDPTTDRPAAGANVAYADTASMTHTCQRAWAQIISTGTGTPTLGSHDAWWGNALAIAPTPLRDGGGIMRLVWTATQQNEIPAGSPGYLGPQPINLRFGWGQAEGSVFYNVQVTITAANQATIRVFNSSGSLVDPTGVVVDVWVG